MSWEMGSRLATTEKRPTKSRGRLGSVFFHFFDWNRMLSKKKKKKKLFSSNKLLLPSVSKKFGGDEKMPKSKHFLMADENLESFPISQKPNGINNQMQDPGPVAKLMGLESMPIVQHKKPSKPSLESEFGSNRYETSEVKETRPRKLQRTGGFMERQQQPVGSSSEAQQSNRTVRRQHHHKLASPVKSPRLLSKRSKSLLMEAATKILEPGLQSRRNHAKCGLTYSSSSQFDEKVSKDDIFMKKYKVSSNDSVVGPSRSFRSLNGTMELCLRDEETQVKEHNHVDNKLKPLENRTSPFSQAKLDAKRSLVKPISEDRPTSLAAPKSLDVQARINAGSRTGGLYEKKNFMQDENSSKNRRKNQLPLVKEKLAYGSKMCNRQSGRRDLVASDSGLSSCTRSRTVIKELGRERVEIERNGLERKNKAPKRRPNDDSQSENGKVVSFTFEKRQSVRTDLINRKGKGVVSNTSISHCSAKSGLRNQMEGGNATSGFEGNGIVSFTFSSPMKHACGSFSNEVADKRRCMDTPSRNASHPKRLVSAEKIHSMTFQREEILRGGSLSALSEPKIEELNSLDTDEMARGNALEGRYTDTDEMARGDALEGRYTASIIGELISALKPSQEDTSCSSSTNITDHTISHGEMVDAKERFQAEAEAGISDAYLVSNGDHLSPMSILDVSLSNDSCFSGSPHGSSGHKPDFGSTDICNNIQQLDLDSDFLDSASSFDIEKFDTEKTSGSLGKISVIEDVSNLHEVWFAESKLSYSTEAKSNAKLLVENISSDSNGEDPFICDTLEAITKSLSVTVAKDGNQLRRLLIDCMIECLDFQYNCFFKAGSNRSLVTRRERLARVVCEEIEGWNGLVGKTMDDIVENEMIHSNGMWTTFEFEAFDTGVQIENCILNELVDEMVIDLCKSLFFEAF